MPGGHPVELGVLQGAVLLCTSVRIFTIDLNPAGTWPICLRIRVQAYSAVQKKVACRPGGTFNCRKTVKRSFTRKIFIRIRTCIPDGCKLWRTSC